MTGFAIVGAALLLAVAFGLYRKAVDGRVRTVRDGAPATTLALDADLGDAATFVQFSSASCAPCRVTARVLEEVTSATAGVAHIEIDAAERLDLVGELGITRTPTVIVLDGAGVVRARLVGAPRRADVIEALSALGAPVAA